MPEAIRNWLEGAGRSRALLVGGAGLLAILAILAIARSAAAPEWVPMLPGLALEEVGKVTAHLDEAGVGYRLERGGTEILVRDDELARARVSLAREGLPARGRPGFELFDRPAWGMTDFTQRINYRRALEGELERTIGQMRGVEAAQVHIAMNESSGFRRASQPDAASVVLTLSAGARPGRELVDGVTSLIASSVDGLASERVTVLDDTGRLLSAAIEPGSTDGLSRRQLQVRRDTEEYLERKAEELIAEATGVGNTRVRVAADLSFDRVDRTTESIDPDQQITTREERSEIVPGEGQQGAGSTAMSAAYEAGRTVETFSGAAGTIRRLTVAVLLNETPASEGEPRAWTAAELASIETLVANAVGIDRVRGDRISVVATPFVQPNQVAPAGEPVPTPLMRVREFRREIVIGVALLLAFILGMQVLRVMRATLAPAPVEGAVAALPSGGEHALEQPSDEAEPAPASQYAGMLARSVESPELAARVLRVWLKES